MTAPKKLYLSASRCKQFLDCSWSFYHGYILKVPDITHPKTKIGTLVHSILECLLNPRHKKTYLAIYTTRDVYSSSSVSRLIEIFLRKNSDITEEIASHINDLVFVALDYDFFQENAKKVLPPEYSFELDLGTFSIKGFIDRLAFYDDKVLIRDYKTQKDKFTKKEVKENIQALFYQLAAWEIFKMPAKVEFLLLRHPKTARNPLNFLQSVEPASESTLNGFKMWLEHINKQISELDAESANDNFKALDDSGFCIRVCKYREPFEYYALVDKENKLIKTSRFQDLEIKDGQKIEKRKYFGCNYFYNAKGQRRSSVELS